MLINEFIENLSEKAVISPLTPSSVVVFDRNELKVYVGFTNCRESAEYAKEVTLLLSTEIPKKAEIREIVVSKNSDFAILVGSRSAHVVRIPTELLVSKADRLAAEYFCECFPLHDSVLLQSSALSVVKCRILAEKCNDKIVAAVLYSDNCIRFYNINRKSNSLLLTIDFRHLLHQNLDESVTNNTFGLQRALVSFDLIPPQPKSGHFSVIVVDSDVEFYASFVHFSCFKEGTSPRIHRLETVEGLPCDPLELEYLETTNPKIASVFVLVSGGGVLSHLVVFPNEFGEFQLLVNDQLRLPQSAGDPKIVTNLIRKLQKNRYEIATSTCLFSVNISPWFDTDGSSGETRVCELVNVVTSSSESSSESKWTGARALKAVSVQLTRSDDVLEEEDSEFESEVMHLVVLDSKHVFTVSSFDNNFYNSSAKPSTTSTASGNMARKPTSSLEQQLAELKPLAACVISDKVSEEEAIEAAMKFFDAADVRLKRHSELATAAVERCLGLAATAQILDEKQQTVDQRLIEETTSIEELKMKMHELKQRMEATRKSMNVLFHRVEENVPLSDNEIRIFDRLRLHQKMLSDMSIHVPKMTLDSNELNRMADNLAKKRIGDERNKFANVDKNASEIENLENRQLKLTTGITEFAV